MQRQKFRTHYDNLKVSERASSKQIRTAYKRLCQKFHPDKNPGCKESERIIRIINQSYQVLIDPLKKKQHDAWIASEKNKIAKQQTRVKRIPNDRVQTNTNLHSKLKNLATIYAQIDAELARARNQAVQEERGQNSDHNSESHFHSPGSVASVPSFMLSSKKLFWGVMWLVLILALLSMGSAERDYHPKSSLEPPFQPSVQAPSNSGTADQFKHIGKASLNSEQIEPHNSFWVKKNIF